MVDNKNIRMQLAAIIIGMAFMMLVAFGVVSIGARSASASDDLNAGVTTSQDVSGADQAQSGQDVASNDQAKSDQDVASNDQNSGQDEVPATWPPTWTPRPTRTP